MYDVVELLGGSKLVIFDSDGCLINGNQLYPDVQKLITKLKNDGKLVLVFSNNSTKHPSKLLDFYQKLSISIDDVVNSSYLTAQYCLENSIERVYIVGESGFHEIIREHGISIVEDNVDAVLVGMDRNLTYEKLVIACREIISGARFIASNPDPNFPTPRGLEPGAGSMIAAIQACTVKEPEIIIGKPATWGYEYIVNKYQLKPEECVMIGDRYETDIVGALDAKIPAILVLTGISKSLEPSDFEPKDNMIIVKSISEMYNLYQSNQSNK